MKASGPAAGSGSEKPGLVSISRRAVAELQERVRSLARQKSSLQLVNTLMNNLSTMPGLENTVEAIIRLLVSSIGGRNVSLYYLVDSRIHYADAYGDKRLLDEVDDAMVRRALENRDVTEEVRDFSDTRMQTPEFTKASYLAVPLTVSGRTIAVLKLEGLLMSVEEVRGQLKPFFRYAALVLKNEIESYSRLRDAYDQLQQAHRDLQKEAEDRFRQQQFLEALLDSAETAIEVCDERGVMTLLNRKAQELHGAPQEPIAAADWASYYGLYSPNGRTLLAMDRVPLYRALQGERFHNDEIVVKPAGADRKVVLAGGQGIRDKDGRTVGAIVALHDITDRKEAEDALARANGELEARVMERTAELQEANARLELELQERLRTQEALRASEERFRSLFENSPVATWEEDVSAILAFFDELRSGGVEDLESHLSRHPQVALACAGMVKLLDVNRAALAMHGAARKSDLLAGLQRVFLPETQAALRRILVALWRGETELTCESVISTLDGKPRDVIVHFSLCPGDLPVPSKLLVSLTDITDRKRAERTRELLSTIVECSDDAIIGKDLRGTIISWNKGAERIYGYSADEVLGKSIEWLVLPDPEELAKVAELTRRGRTIDHFETERVRKDGRRISVSLTISPLKDAGGSVFGEATIASDISDRIRRDAEITRLNRLYVVLSRTNQAIVRSRDQAKLLDEVCRIAVEDGEFRFVVVEREDPHTHAVTAVACHGSGEGAALSPVWESVRASCAGQGAGCGERAGIRVMNDLTCVSITLPQLGHICAASCRSFAALPLKVGDRVWGTIQYFAAEPGFFDAQEVQLLAELAEDLGYAIETLQLAEQRRLIEDALESSQEELSAIYNRAPVVMGLLDDELRVVRLNDAASRLTQRSRDALLGLQPGQVLGCANALRTPYRCGEDPLCGSCSLRRALTETLVTGRGQSDVETTVKLAQELGGGEECMVVHTARLTVGGKNRVLICAENISARKRTEEALRDSEMQYRLLAENIHDVIWVLDLETRRFRYLSPSVERLVGTPAGELVDSDFMAWIAPESRQKVQNGILDRGAELLDDGDQVFTDEIALQNKSGEAVWTESVTRLRRNAGNGHVELYGVSRDITARKRLEERLRQSQKMEAIGQLAGGVAHDFNNILAAIMMQLDLLGARPDLDALTQGSLKEMEAEARRAARLTQQLLLFSRRSMIHVGVLDLNELVDNLFKMLRRLLGEHIDLQLHFGNELPRVEADAGMLEQVVMNLAVNARDAMPRGGQLVMATEAASFDAVQAAERPERRPGIFVCLSVADTGVGMDAATRIRIFEPFFTTKEVGKGTGLGLATVFGIVAQHKGWVEVESTVGRGSVFRVYLPALASTAETAPSAVPDEQVRGGSESILLVEDEPDVREMVKEYLEILGYRVLEAGNGKEALDLWAEHGARLDLLFTDMVMPEGLTGLELAERLRASKPGLKVIVSSGYSLDLAQGAGTGHADIVYLPKPYQGPTLAATLRRCLDGA